MSFKFTADETREIETYATLIASGVCVYTEIALGKASYRGGRIGVDPNNPHRLQILAAIRKVAVAKGYAGPPLPEGDPSAALIRRQVLTDLLAGEPRDESWLDRREFYEREIVKAPLDDPDGLEELKARLRGTYRQAEPETTPTAAEGPAALPWVGQRQRQPNAALFACTRGQHQFGAVDGRGWRECQVCHVVNVCPDDNPGAIDRIRSGGPFNHP